MKPSRKPKAGRRTRQGYIHDGVGYIPLTHGEVAICDPRDVTYLSQWNWNIGNTKERYVTRTQAEVQGRRCILMSRQLMSPPAGYHVDHINHNTLDNRRCNLRVCLPHENNKNVKKQQGVSSRYLGVHWSEQRKAWVAAIFHGHQYWLGDFTDEEDAAIVYNVAAQIFRGEFANLNPV